MSNDKDILNNLERIESLMDGILELSKSEEDLAKTIGHLSFDGLKTNIHDPQEFGIIAPISEPVAVTRPRQMEIFERAQFNQPEGHRTPESSKRTIETANQRATRPFGQDVELSYMGYNNPTKIFGANVNWDERVTPGWKIPKPHQRRHFSAVKEGTKMNLLGLKGHETEHSLFDLVARKYGSGFRADLAAHLVRSMPQDSREIAQKITNRIAGYSPIEDKDFFDEETINVHHNFLMSPEYREYVYKKLYVQTPQQKKQMEDAMKRGWQHLMRASRQVRPNHIDPSISINDVPIPKKPKREGVVAKSEDRVHSSSDPVVYDISKAPEQHLTPEFYRITPQVQQAYEMMGRGRAVAHGQFISDPSPSIGSGVTVAFDNDEDLHNYIKDVYEPHLKKNVLPSMVPDKSVILAPIPTKSIRHGNQSPFLTIDHLHGVSLSQDRRGRIPFYYTMSKLASQLGHVHPMIPPAISEYTEGPHQHHVIRMVDGNGRTVSARTAGSSHVLSYVAMKPEHVHPFLKMLHETSPNENLVVRSILGVNDLPSEFTIKDIPTVISHTKKAEEDILNTMNRMEVLFDALAGRR